MEMIKEIYKDLNTPATFDKDFVKEAYLFAEAAHRGQTRRSGDKYIEHPLAVARILLELGIYDHQIIAAALLHDVLEDTEVTLKEITEKFGPKVAALVAGVTNLGKVDFSAYSSRDEAEEAQLHLKNENLRQLFLSMAEDVRVVIIKLADRLHNMRTIKALPKKDQIRISKETLNIFGPLALRLGMGEIKGQLEDLAFPIAYPDEYRFLKKEANRRFKAADRYMLTVKRIISDKLGSEGIPANVEGRAKHIYSLYKKITREEINWDFDKVYDLVALRIITDSVSDCYRILGSIHSLFRPIPNYIRDYIAAPKPNGYRSIHTSVFGPEGKIVEIQIRTKEMHEEAEFGVASHLHYSEQKEAPGKSDAEAQKGFFAPKGKTDFLREIKEWQSSIQNADDFVEGLKIEFLDDRIYVFSPKGDIYDLPYGSTPLDFAYEVHSKIGDTCRGAKVNGRMVPLDHRLKTRDVVEIITQKNTAPKRDWLEFVKTSKARQHIRAHFRKFHYDKNKAEGKKAIESELALLGLTLNSLTEAEIKSALSETSFKTLDDVCASVGIGLTTPRQAIKIIFRRPFIVTDTKRPGEAGKRPKTEDFKGMKIQVAPCCEPGRHDQIICYISRGQGLRVHRKDCPNVNGLEKRRLYEFNPWKAEEVLLKLEVMAASRVGLIRDVTDVISKTGVNIERFKNQRRRGAAKTRLEMVLNIEDLAQGADLVKRISEVKDVLSVKKI